MLSVLNESIVLNDSDTKALRSRSATTAKLSVSALVHKNPLVIFP